MTRQEMKKRLREEFDFAPEAAKDGVLTSYKGKDWTPRLLIAEVESDTEIGVEFVDMMIAIEELKNSIN